MQKMDVGLAERHSLALVGRHLVGVDTFEVVIYLPWIESDKDRHLARGHHQDYTVAQLAWKDIAAGVGVALAVRADQFFAALDKVFDHFSMKEEDSVVAAEMQPGWAHMAASALDNNHFALLASDSLVHSLLLHRLAHIRGNGEDIRVVILGEVVAACCRGVHKFVRAWFVSWVEGIHQEAQQLSSLSATFQVEGQHQIYSKRLHLVDCSRHGHIRSAGYHSAYLADNQPWCLLAMISSVSRFIFGCHRFKHTL
jgi:hypothetical protein